MVFCLMLKPTSSVKGCSTINNVHIIRREIELKPIPYLSSDSEFVDTWSYFLNRALTSSMRVKISMPAQAAYLAIGLMLLTSHSVWAAAETNLGSVGRTQLQQDTGDAVQKTCGGFIAAGAVPGEIPLFDTCRAMVHNGNEVNETEGPTADSLGLTSEQLADALQQVATEEFAVTESMTSEISTKRLGTFLTRLGAVRGGGRGFSLAGFTPDKTDSLASAYPGFNGREGATGGSAGNDDNWGKWGAFLNASYGAGDRDGSVRTDGFDFDTYSMVAGVDYRVTESLVLGGALSYQDIDTDFDTNATVNGGNVDADGWGGFVYGTYFDDNFYVDGLIGYAQSDYQLSRRIAITGLPDETATADTDSSDLTLSAGGGYNFNQGALSYGPYVRLTYLNVDVDGYNESGAGTTGLNLSVDGQDWTSLTSVLGGQLAYAVSSDFGVWSPQARVAWVHEFENDAQVFEATYIADPRNNVLRASTDEPDRNYFELGLGVSAVLQSGTQLFFNYETILGFSDLTDHVLTLGGRMEF